MEPPDSCQLTVLPQSFSGVGIVYNASPFELNKIFTSSSNFHAPQQPESHNSLGNPLQNCTYLRHSKLSSITVQI